MSTRDFDEQLPFEMVNWVKPALLRNSLLIFTIVAGTLLRFYPVWQAGFVIHDGGMFYVMARDIQAGGYRLPVFTSYNQAQIPFAYPLLMLYLLAVLDGRLHVPLLVLLRWLPPLTSTLTIPVFFILARRLLASDEQAALATVFFALAPSSLGAQIMGGGLTRAAGALFTLLFLYFLYLALRNPMASRSTMFISRKPLANRVGCMKK